MSSASAHPPPHSPPLIVAAIAAPDRDLLVTKIAIFLNDCLEVNADEMAERMVRFLACELTVVEP